VIAHLEAHRKALGLDQARAAYTDYAVENRLLRDRLDLAEADPCEPV
jgi:hypothetical protein